MTFGADAVGGVLSTVVVPVTVDVTVFVSAIACVENKASVATVNNIVNVLNFIIFIVNP